MQDPTLRTVSPPTGSPPQQGHRPCPWDKSNLKALATGAGSNQHAPTLAKPLHQPSSDHDATAGFPIAAAMSAGAQHAASAVRGPVATARRNRSRSGSPTSMVAAWLGELGLGHLEQEFASEVHSCARSASGRPGVCCVACGADLACGGTRESTRRL
eukprot:2855749-Rhodomonas_salina.2